MRLVSSTCETNQCALAFALICCCCVVKVAVQGIASSNDCPGFQCNSSIKTRAKPNGICCCNDCILIARGSILQRPSFRGCLFTFLTLRGGGFFFNSTNGILCVFNEQRLQPRPSLPELPAETHCWQRKRS